MVRVKEKLWKIFILLGRSPDPTTYPVAVPYLETDALTDITTRDAVKQMAHFHITSEQKQKTINHLRRTLHWIDDEMQAGSRE
jgi:hypothetical protein